MSEDSFGCVCMWKDAGSAIGILWVEARDAAKYPTMQGQSPQFIWLQMSIVYY